MRLYRPFSVVEKANMTFLTTYSINYTLLHITATGKRKHIFDATKEIRNFLVSNGIHDFTKQRKESSVRSYKKTVESFFIVRGETKNSVIKIPTMAVFYRPQTKKGDPRFNVYRIERFTTPDDIYAIVASKDRELYLLNITQLDLHRNYSSAKYNFINQLVDTYLFTKQQIVDELFAKFNTLKGVWIPSVSKPGVDNAVGDAVEAALGIPRNSSNNPDYKGIEIKSRKLTSKRYDLFGHKPDWDNSVYKNGHAIVEKYGKDLRGCGMNYIESTFNYDKPHPTYDLLFKMNTNKTVVTVYGFTRSAKGKATHKTPVIKWKMEDLHDSLALKHSQTFWVNADHRNNLETGQDEFMIRDIYYTKDPDPRCFDRLMEQGDIKLDLSLDRPSGHGDNYKFHLAPKAVEKLFTTDSHWVF